MKKLKFDSYDGVCFLNGLVFFAPVALLVRTQAGVSEHVFFLLQALLSDGKNGKSGRGKLPAVTAATAGVAFLLFGVVKFRAAVLLLMLILPLLLNLPEYLLMNLENQFVDETECGSQRAATLSVLNMGVNLVEILTLSASAFLTKIGIQWCFVFVGCFLMAIALLFARIQK
jgi:sugar phosphate permease